MNDSIARWILVAAVLSAAGCARQSARQEPPDDLAMQWARYDREMPEDAARDYFLPCFYYDPDHPDEDVPNYFKGMDRIALTKGEPLGPLDQLQVPVSQLLDKAVPEFEPRDRVTTHREVLGRNSWMIWCGGNERFWDWLANNSFGFADVLKLVDSRDRTTRFRESGLISEPGTIQAGGPAAGEFGLWLDVPTDEKARQWRAQYVKTTFDQLRRRVHPSQRGSKDFRGERPKRNGYGGFSDEYPNHYPYYDKEIPPPDIYGLSSGVVGLRLFPNPDFDEAAQKKWEPEKYYNDPKYYGNPDLIRPFRVGMSCGFCHASYHPLNPPRDVANPGWENISGNIGAQYLRIRSIFGNLLTKENFIYHLLDSQPPGTIDTSLIASDNINNPNAMNPVFHFPQRALLSFKNPPEKLSAASAGQPSIWEYPEAYPPNYAYDTVPKEYRELFEKLGLEKELKESNDNPRFVPRILLDGSDSIGAWGALARVYLNIGTYSEQWNRLHRPIVGFDPQQPFTIKDCESHSVYWHATQLRVPALREYFLKVTPTMPLIATENGTARLEEADSAKLKKKAGDDKKELAKLEAQERAKRIDKSKLQNGRKVFARNCIVCHSSIQPEVEWAKAFAFDQKEFKKSVVALAGKTSELARRRQQVEEQRKDLAEQQKRLDERAKAAGEDPERLAEDRKQLLEDVKSLESERMHLGWLMNHEVARQSLADRRRAKLTEWQQAGEFWDHDPGQWLRDREYIAWAEAVVENKDFWRLNYLSTDFRIPVNVVRTNSGRAMATNAIDQNMWDDFASESYQRMPSVGAIEFFNPYKTQDDGADRFTPRHKVRNNAPAGGGGVGFYRVPTLVSIWATAPLLHNNSLGQFTNDPSIDGRLVAFDDGIRKLLWPEKRLESSSYNEATSERLKQDHGLIWRTPQETYISLPAQNVPKALVASVPFLMKLLEKFPWLKTVRPLWLPSALFMLAAFSLLLVDPERPQRKTRLIGSGAVIVAAVIAVVFYFVRDKSGWLDWLDSMLVIGLLVAAWLLVGLILLAISGERIYCVLGWTAFVLAAVSFVLHVLHRFLAWFAWLADDPAWLVAAILLPLGIVLLSLGDVWKIRRLGCAALFLAAWTLVLFLLHDRPDWFAWLGELSPAWLLSAVLLLVGIVLVWQAESQKIRRCGYAALILAAAVCLLHGGAGWIPWLHRVHPLAVLGVLLLLAGIAFLKLVHSELARWLGFAALFLAAASFSIYLHQRRPGMSAALDWAGPLWPLSVLLIVWAFLFYVSNHRRLARWLGYEALLLSLVVGFFVYFLDGKLGDFHIGPIPKGTPVNLLANVNPDADPKDMKQAIKVTVETLAEIKSRHLDEKHTQQLIRDQIAPALMRVNKCPDFVMDKGHYFEWFQSMSDEDKESLIELLKTF